MTAQQPPPRSQFTALLALVIAQGSTSLSASHRKTLPTTMLAYPCFEALAATETEAGPSPSLLLFQDIACVLQAGWKMLETI